MSEPTQDAKVLEQIAVVLAASDSEDVAGAVAIIAAYREEIEARAKAEGAREALEWAADIADRNKDHRVIAYAIRALAEPAPQ